MIDSARLYLVSPAHIKAGPLAPLVGDLVKAGVDIVQLREKEMEGGELLRAAEPIALACKEADVPFIVNDRADVAFALSDAGLWTGVHVGQRDLPSDVARAIVGQVPALGVSTHTVSEIDDALTRSELLDYIAVGPVFETPTKPGRPAVGLDLVRYAAEYVSLTWFAIGGINAANIDAVMAAGAQRVVVVRAITEADDPASAAAELKAKLAAAPL